MWMRRKVMKTTLLTRGKLVDALDYVAEENLNIPTDIENTIVNSMYFSIDIFEVVDIVKNRVNKLNSDSPCRCEREEVDMLLYVLSKLEVYV